MSAFAVGATAAVALCAAACVAPEEAPPICAQSVLLRTWSGESDQSGSDYGIAVASGDLNGDGFDDTLVGASSFDGVASNEGRVFAYAGSTEGLDLVPTWTLSGVDPPDFLGGVLASGFDLNGDGFDDVVVGTADYGSGRPRVELHLGSSGGPVPEASWTFQQTLPIDTPSAANAGDFDGDGFDDLIVGSPRDAGGIGSAVLFFGSADGLKDDARVVLTGDPTQAGGFGARVASAGDVDGDGFDDVLVAAPDWYLQELRGGVFLFRGSDETFVQDPWMPNRDWPSEALGSAIAGAGDVDGDGFDDVLVSTYDYDASLLDARVRLYRGSASGLREDWSWEIRSHALSVYEPAFAGVGDVDGDGFDDVLVTAELTEVEGTVMLFRGGPDGLATKPAWDNTPQRDGAYGGASVAAAGDANGDGYREILVGVSDESTDQDYEGRAFVYAGSCAW